MELGTVDVAAERRTSQPPRVRAHTADFVRVVLFTWVVVAHCVNGISTPDAAQPAGLVGTLCHLTRYGFVAVTLFVLVLSTQNKNVTPIVFWRRRFGLVVGPYLAWTLIYSITDHVVIGGNPFTGPREYFGTLGAHLLTGDGKYQLYFLLISMQIYLVFPAVGYVLRRNRNRPWRLVVAGFVVQTVMFVVYQYLPRPRGAVWDAVYEHAWKTLPMYALFIAIGAVGAQHLDTVQRWLSDHAVAVVAAAVGATAISVTAYLLATSPGEVPGSATTPWNLTLLPWLVGGFAMLWLVAMAWNDRRGDGRGIVGRVVAYATPRAFGVFAVHPLVIDILGRIGFLDGLFSWFPHAGATRAIVLVLTVLAGSLLMVDLLLRTSLSQILVARKRIPFGWRRFLVRRPAVGALGR
ncbi:acyltransferase [Gordonia effusa]|uniref:acyltransferase n=1 Tax=Gordonia effusa TaxID=263908 RepID=UPI001FE1244A|nr:acyltransferase [Gordonia effusa]